LLFYANTPEMLVSVGVLEVGMHFFAFDMLKPGAHGACTDGLYLNCW
jgi:hypothetical protein